MSACSSVLMLSEPLWAESSSPPPPPKAMTAAAIRMITTAIGPYRMSIRRVLLFFGGGVTSPPVLVSSVVDIDGSFRASVSAEDRQPAVVALDEVMALSSVPR
jgi:hypothetical protein